MQWLSHFWYQPTKRYRNFQIAFTILTLNFVIPAVSYALDPATAIDQFRWLNELIGGEAYTFPEADSRVWRYLGAANVMTLGLMCFLLQLNLRANFPLLLPLTFLKGYNASLFLFGYFASPQFPILLGVAVFDFLTCAAFVYFARSARRDLEETNDDVLVPCPVGFFS